MVRCRDLAKDGDTVAARRRSLWLAAMLAVVCGLSGATLLYVRWLPPDALEAWNSAARYARWIFTETLPLLGGTLAAAAWLVGIRRHATQQIEALDDELAELTKIAANMRVLGADDGEDDAHDSARRAATWLGSRHSLPYRCTYFAWTAGNTHASSAGTGFGMRLAMSTKYRLQSSQRARQ
jgi:hypothetical protein